MSIYLAEPAEHLTYPPALPPPSETVDLLSDIREGYTA